MNKILDGKVYIGTSGIAVPGNKKTFPLNFQSKSRLNYYAAHFNSIEINSSFYQIPMMATFIKWSLDVPENFKFTLKIYKEITHVKNLEYDLVHIDAFCNAAAGLGDKKGCLLLQFPGKISLDKFTAVENILIRLSQQKPSDKWATAVEFRNPDWYVSETAELLEQYNSTMVVHDFAKAKNIKLPEKNKHIYLRFHGPAGDYRGDYSNEFLEEQAIKIKQCIKDKIKVFVYFNNTMGNAWQNASTLRSYLLKIL